jgi:Spy/CpxP family protein refolding chaperone
MRPTRWLPLASLFLTALPFLVSPAYAGPHGGPGGPEGRLERQLSKLGLDANQQQKVQAIFDAAKPQRDEIRGQMRQAFQDMHALLDQDNPDQAAVLAQADRIGQISTAMHKGMLTTLLAVRAELTPEQRAKLKESMREHGPGHWRHGHHGDSPGNAPEATPEN